LLAEGDESALQYPLPDYIFGFHGQQSCEKLLKALISSHNVRFPLTHEFEDLVDLLVGSGEALPVLPYTLDRLQPFAVKLRYDLGVKLSETQREDIRTSVAILREHVIARILELESQP
jgi:hypothetical protein